jgi:GH25 family lysozyme M1 (1,4-beta-N-acetylmuramidase)
MTTSRAAGRIVSDVEWRSLCKTIGIGSEETTPKDIEQYVRALQQTVEALLAESNRAVASCAY